jgi:hypothetical protein
VAEATTQTPGGDRRADRTPSDRKPTHEAIRRAVLKAMGSPVDLFRVDVHRLWENHYRINVWTGLDVHSARVTNTYFLTTDDAGLITNSTPRITKEYV